MQDRFRLGLIPFAMALLFAGPVAMGSAKDFNFKDPKGVNAMSFVLDSLLEPIMGLATGISGTVTFDPAEPEATTGKIVVAAESLHIENQGMEKTLHGADWIDVAMNPEVSFTFRKVEHVKESAGGVIEMDVTGDFSLKGVTKSITIPVRATHLPDRLADRMHRGSGDLLVFRARFSINRKDYGIKPDSGDDVVANEIEIRVSIVGLAAGE